MEYGSEQSNCRPKRARELHFGPSVSMNNSAHGGTALSLENPHQAAQLPQQPCPAAAPNPAPFGPSLPAENEEEDRRRRRAVGPPPAAARPGGGAAAAAAGWASGAGPPSAAALRAAGLEAKADAVMSSQDNWSMMSLKSWRKEALPSSALLSQDLVRERQRQVRKQMLSPRKK